MFVQLERDYFARTDRQTSRQTDRQTDRQTGRRGITKVI